MIRPDVLSPGQLAWLDIELTLAAHSINLETRMPTISDQLKAARAQMAEVRQSAASAVAEAADTAGLVRQEVSKVLKEAADMRAELAGLTNGGPVLDEPAATPLPPVPQPVGSVDHASASGVNIPGVTTY